MNDILVLQLCQPTDPGRQRSLLRDILGDAITALNVWHRLWSILKHEGEWEAYGFWKNGDQYELAIRLLLSENARPELQKLLGAHVNRLDALKDLNARAGQER